MAGLRRSSATRKLLEEFRHRLRFRLTMSIRRRSRRWLTQNHPLVRPVYLALIHGSTFFAATEEGALAPPGSPNIGLFYQDTRFLSHYELRTNGQAPALLSCNSTGADLARVGLTVRGGAVAGTDLDLPINTIFIDREFLLGRDRLFDTLTIQNFHHTNVKLTVELLFSADFMDIFQVRGLLRGKSGRYARPLVEDACVRFRYEGLDDRIRFTEIGFAPRPQLLEGTSCAMGAGPSPARADLPDRYSGHGGDLSR